MPQEDTPQITAGKPGRRWRYVFGAALLALAGIIAAPFLYLSYAGGLAGVLQTQLSARLGGAPVSIGDVGVELRLPSMFFTLVANDVEISLDDSRIMVPQARAEFSPQSLLKVEPSEVALSGLDVEQNVSREGWQHSNAGGLFAAMAAGGRDESGRAGTPRQIMIDNAGLTLRQPGADGDILQFGNVELSMAVAEDGTFIASLEGQRETENDKGGVIALTAIGDFTSRHMRLDVVAEAFSAAALHLSFRRCRSPLPSGRLSGSASLVVAEARLQAADIDMVSIGGSIDMSAVRLPRLDYDTASVVMGYQRESGRLSLAQGEVTLADGRTIALSGDVDGLNDDVVQLAFRFRGNNGRSTKSTPIGPTAWPPARAGLMERFAGGNLTTSPSR